jgi:hypothetical protein
MADSTILNLDLQVTGANAGTWGSNTNDNLEKVENAIKGYALVSVAGSGTIALTASSGGTGDQQSRASLKLTGTLSGAVALECEANPYWYFIHDASTRAGYALTFGPAGGTAITLPYTSTKYLVYTDGSTAFDILTNVGNISSGGTLSATGDISFDGGAFVFNETGIDKDARFEGLGDPQLLRTEATNDRVGIGIAAPLAKLGITQTSATGAVPCIELEQIDQDFAFTNYKGTSAADSSSSISSSTAEAASKFGAVMIKINGVTKWIRVYDSAV